MIPFRFQWALLWQPAWGEQRDCLSPVPSPAFHLGPNGSVAPPPIVNTTPTPIPAQKMAIRVILVRMFCWLRLGESVTFFGMQTWRPIIALSVGRDDLVALFELQQAAARRWLCSGWFRLSCGTGTPFEPYDPADNPSVKSGTLLTIPFAELGKREGTRGADE